MSARLTLMLCAGIGILVGCSGPQPPIGALGAMPHSRAIAQHAGRGKSWMSPEARSIKELLYVSDSKDSRVDVYDFESGRRMGALTGFVSPSGQCVDARGNVFIADLDLHQLTEYAHGGATPVKTFGTRGYPNGCSVDPLTGDLAASTWDTPSGNGNIVVWKQASGTPNVYTSPDFDNFFPPGYDGAGNLFAEGGGQKKHGYHYRYGVAELPAGGSSLQRVALNHRIWTAASVMWDGEYITFADQGACKINDCKDQTKIYRAAETGSSLQVVDTTVLGDDCKSKYADVSQPFIVVPKHGRQSSGESIVVGGNNVCAGHFDYWHYPGGGSPFLSLKRAPEASDGASVSLAPQR